MTTMTNPTTEFAAWCAENPPPSLQALIDKYGGYWDIPHEAWCAHLMAMRDWEGRRKDRFVRGPVPSR